MPKTVPQWRQRAPHRSCLALLSAVSRTAQRGRAAAHFVEGAEKLLSLQRLLHSVMIRNRQGEHHMAITSSAERIQKGAPSSNQSVAGSRRSLVHAALCSGCQHSSSVHWQASPLLGMPQARACGLVALVARTDSRCATAARTSMLHVANAVSLTSQQRKFYQDYVFAQKRRHKNLSKRVR